MIEIFSLSNRVLIINWDWESGGGESLENRISLDLFGFDMLSSKCL